MNKHTSQTHNYRYYVAKNTQELWMTNLISPLLLLFSCLSLPNPRVQLGIGARCFACNRRRVRLYTNLRGGIAPRNVKVIAGIVTTGKAWRGSFRLMATDLIAGIIAGVGGHGPAGCTGLGLGENRGDQGAPSRRRGGRSAWRCNVPLCCRVLDGSQFWI